MSIDTWRDILEAESSRSAAQIEHNGIDLVIFLRDPMTPEECMSLRYQGHPASVRYAQHPGWLRTLATAELLIKSLDRGDLEWREMYK